MGKKQDFGQGTIISIYRFMEYCGLECPKKENILISHHIMMRKLYLRNQKFPDVVLVPVPALCQKLKKEDVYTGTFYLVEDDYGKILPYYLHKKLAPIEHVSAEEMARRRELCINRTDDESYEMKDGYKKYLYRKSMRELEETKKSLLEMARLDRENPEPMITEKVTRYARVKNRKHTY